MKRSVEFVADRVSSNHIKQFRTHVLPSYMASSTSQAQKLAADNDAILREGKARVWLPFAYAIN